LNKKFQEKNTKFLKVLFQASSYSKSIPTTT
jgi:hypothetical protein